MPESFKKKNAEECSPATLLKIDSGTGVFM